MTRHGTRPITCRAGRSSRTRLLALAGRPLRFIPPFASAGATTLLAQPSARVTSVSNQCTGSTSAAYQADPFALARGVFWLTLTVWLCGHFTIPTWADSLTNTGIPGAIRLSALEWWTNPVWILAAGLVAFARFYKPDSSAMAGGAPALITRVRL